MRCLYGPRNARQDDRPTRFTVDLHDPYTRFSSTLVLPSIFYFPSLEQLLISCRRVFVLQYSLILPSGVSELPRSL